MQIIQYILKTLGRMVMFGVVCAFGLVIIVGATYAILSKLLPADSLIWKNARCWVGVQLQSDSECWQGKLKKLEKSLLQDFQKRRDEQEQKHNEHLKKLAILKIRKEAEHQKLLKIKQATLVKSQRQNKELQRVKDQLATQIARLANIEKRWSDINLFEKKSFKGGSTVTSGVRYPSLIHHQKWDKAWCYWEPPIKRAAQISIKLAEATPSDGVAWKPISNTLLAEAGVTRTDIKSAKALCIWPQGLS